MLRLPVWDIVDEEFFISVAYSLEEKNSLTLINVTYATLSITKLIYKDELRE